MIQIACWILATIYAVERTVKYIAVLSFFRRKERPAESGRPARISVLQPILSGDPQLSRTLAHNLALERNWPIEFIWLVDVDDPVADETCRSLIQKHDSVDIRLVHVPRGSTRESPKIVKLKRGLELAAGDVIMVLDDDTMLPVDGLGECISLLGGPGTGLVFGLPYYKAFATWSSSLVSCFVNSNSLMTYIPYTYLIEPMTINGMFYLMRRDRLISVGGFDGLERTLADDFAVARRFRNAGYRLIQSGLRHGIYTHVTSLRGYFQLLRRWFVFSRETVMRDLTWRELGVAYSMAFIPCLLPPVVLGLAIAAPSFVTLGLLLSCVLVHLVIFLHLNARFLAHATPARSVWLVTVLQFLIPVQLVAAILLPQRIQWRRHVIHVERGGTFRVVRHRADGVDSTQPTVEEASRSRETGR